MSQSSIDHVVVRMAFEIALALHKDKVAGHFLGESLRLRRMLFDLVERHEVPGWRPEDAVIGPGVRIRARRVYRELTSPNPCPERIAALILPGQTAVTEARHTCEISAGDSLVFPEAVDLVLATAGGGTGIIQVDG